MQMQNYKIHPDDYSDLLKSMLYSTILVIPAWWIVAIPYLILFSILGINKEIDHWLANNLGISFLFIAAHFWLLMYFTSCCKHGVVYGKAPDKWRCSICKSENDEIERLQQIAKNAEQLRSTEVDRLEKARAKSLKYLLSMEPSRFEDFIAKLFTDLGFDVTQTPYSSDGGKDAIALKDGKKYLIECKKYAADNLVGRPDLQKFYGAMAIEKADGGYFVTTSRFTDHAIYFIKHSNIKEAGIELVTGDLLLSLIKETYPNENNIKSVNIMCLYCGNVLECELSEQEKTCSCNTIVMNNITGRASLPKRKNSYYGKRFYRKY